MGAVVLSLYKAENPELYRSTMRALDDSGYFRDCLHFYLSHYLPNTYAFQ